MAEGVALPPAAGRMKGMPAALQGSTCPALKKMFDPAPMFGPESREVRARRYVRYAAIVAVIVQTIIVQFENISLAAVTELWSGKFGKLNEIWFDGGISARIRDRVVALLETLQTVVTTPLPLSRRRPMAR